MSRRAVEAARARSLRAGVLDGEDMARVFAWLRPNDLVWNYWVNNYLMGQNPPAFDILFWNNDTTRLPAGLHSDFLDLYLTNGLVEGTLEVLGTPVDLGKVELRQLRRRRLHRPHHPLGRRVPTTQLLGGDSQFVLSNGGHIQAILNPPDNPKASYFTSDSLPATAAEWREGATQVTGSWWTQWHEWLAERSGHHPGAARPCGQRGAPAARTRARALRPPVSDGAAHLRPRRRAPPAGVRPRRRPADPPDHGVGRQHRDVGPAGARAPRPGVPDDRLRRVRAPGTRHPGSSRCGHTASPARPPTSWTPRPARRPRARRVVRGRRRPGAGLRNPHRVRRLVLASTSCGLGGVPGNPLALGLLATPLRYYSPRFLQATARWMYGPVADPDGRLMHQQVNARRSRPPTLWGYAEPALRDRGLDEPSVVAPHRRTDARRHRWQGPHRPTRERADPRIPHS